MTKHKLQTTASCLGKKNKCTMYLLKAQFAVAQALDQWQLNIPVQEGNPLVPEGLASNSFDQEHLQQLLPQKTSFEQQRFNLAESARGFWYFYISQKIIIAKKMG